MARYNEDLIVDWYGAQVYDIKEKIDTKERDNDIYYTTQEGETLRDIANKKYENSKLYWIIAEYNNIRDPWVRLSAGKLLRMPSRQHINDNII